MFGNWRWNLFFGLFGASLITLLSLFYNPLMISLIRGVYAFVTFFVFAFPIRFVAGIIFSSHSNELKVEPVAEETSGSMVNMSTPDEHNDLNDLLKAQLTNHNVKNESVTQPIESDIKAHAFEPLKPPQLVSSEKLQAEEMTKALRHLTGE